MARKTQTIEQLDASIKRWKTRLRRAVNTLGTLEKRRNRLAAKAVEPKVPASTLVAAVKGHIARQTKAEPPPGFMELAGAGIERPVVEPGPLSTPGPLSVIDTGIPDFLKRSNELERLGQKLADQSDSAADQIREEIAATKKAKTAGRIAKMKAKKAGDLNKMPLSGRAALDAIKNG